MPSLSPHLFWDSDPAGVDVERHTAWLVKRVSNKVAFLCIEGSQEPPRPK